MKGRILRRRTRARASGAGYTLIELMVVVILIAMLAMMAAPSLVRARSDRLAFAYARDVAGAIHGARSRSAGRGSAHLVLFQQVLSGEGRGVVLVFEALDGTTSSDLPPGPNPSPGCRRTGQWTFANNWTPGTTDSTNRALLVDAVNLNVTGGAGEVVVQENIRMRANFSPAASATPTANDVGAFVLCTTPNGTTYFGRGGTPEAAIDAMLASTTPFTDVIEIDVARHVPGNDTTIVGLNRRVIVAGAGAPRIKSE